MIPPSHRNRYTLAAASLAGLLALGACSAGETAGSTTVAADCTPAHGGLTTVSDGTLTVGVPENLPYSQTEDGGGASGLEIDMIELLAAAECLDTAYVPITYATGIPMISEQRTVDMVVGGWYVTEARAEQVGFTTPTTYDVTAVISADGISTVEELVEAGAVATGTGFAVNEDLSPLLGGELREYAGTAEMMQELVNGRVEAAIDGYGVASVAYADTDFVIEILEPDERVAITLDPALVAFPIDKDNPDLSDALSELLDGYREDGTLADLLAEYDLPADMLVPADAASESIR